MKSIIADYSYQEELEKKVIKKFDSGYWETVLAAGCSSGKTRMSISIAGKYLKANPNMKILVLTHGQTVLRSQYYKELEDLNPNFSYGIINGRKDKLTNQLTVALPQSVGKLVKSVDMIIVDEAHHFYLAKLVQNIIEKTSPGKILLLTGSPSPFVAREYKIISMSVSQLLDKGVISDTKIVLVKSAYNFNATDLNPEHELSTNYKFKKKDTDETMDIIKGRIKGKTLIACKNSAHAFHVSAALKERGFSVLVSTHGNDLKAENVKSFLKGTAQVLVVVYRAILGFSWSELETVFDITGSHNPDRIFQLMSRVIRKSNTQKHFYKITTEDMQDYTFSVMSLVAALAMPDVYENYKGLIGTTEFPIDREFLEKLEEEKKNRHAGGGKLLDKNFEYTFDSLHRSRSKKEYAWTTIAEVKKLLHGKPTILHPFRNELVKMAQAGMGRPAQRTKIGKYLCRFVTPSSPYYDSSFKQALEDANIGWFKTPKEIFYEEIFALAKSGDKKPHARSKIMHSLVHFRKKDKTLMPKLMKMRPEWFNPTKETKDKLLLIAASGPKPKKRSSPEMLKFHSYINPNRNGYDPDFVKALRKINPTWLKLRR